MEDLKFEISSALKNILGKDLITDDFVAIFELVKNSLDAGSNHTKIKFDLKNEKIFIIDDGKGMSREDIIQKWLFVAYSAKKEGTEDKESKNYAGNKGVGRFSCDRLGSLLHMQTKTLSDNLIHDLKVDWEDFEENSKYIFTDIPVRYTTSSNFINDDDITLKESGTVLEISNLRDLNGWTRDKFLRLRRSLEKLVDPLNQSLGVLELIVPSEINNDDDELNFADSESEPQIVNGPITNKAFTILKDKTTTLFAEIINDQLKIVLNDRGVEIYTTKEPIKDRFPFIVNCGFKAQISYLNRSAKIIFKKRTGLNAIDYGSLFLLRNGYRIYPIGESGDDYWGIDRRKQQGYSRYLGSREINGFIKVEGSDTYFKESTSRDKGLIKNEPVKQLLDLVLLCLRKLEMYVVDITWRDQIDSEKSSFERMNLDSNKANIIQMIEKLSFSNNIEVLSYNQDLISILNEKALEFEPSLGKLKNIAINLNNEDLIQQVNRAETALLKSKQAEQEAERIAELELEARKKAEYAVKKKTEELAKTVLEKERVEKAYEEEKKRSLFLTLADSREKEILETFMHQIIFYAADLKSGLEIYLEDQDQFNNLSYNEFIDFITDQLELTEKIMSTSRFATTGNFRLKSEEITEDINLFISDYIDKITPGYHEKMKIINNLNVKEYVTLFNPIELGMIIENIINNSDKAKATEIIFSSKIINKILEIEITDNGQGLDKSIIEKNRIFDKGFSRTEGSGIGLYFTKSYLERYAGEISIPDSQPDDGFTLLIKVVKK